MLGGTTHPNKQVICGALRRNGGSRRACAAAKVRVVAARSQDPVVPADFLERYVQPIAAALRHAGRAVDAAPLPLHRLAGRCVDDDERPIAVVERE